MPHQQDKPASAIANALRGLYVITDPNLLPGNKLYEGVELALQGGAMLVQYRNKPADEATRLHESSQLLNLAREYEAKLIINDDVDLCLRIGAHGVHLGRSDGDIARARQQLGSEQILGVTCHADLDYAQQATLLGADYCAFGRLYPSLTKPMAPACPTQLLGRAKQAGLCTVAIGGINQDNAAQTLGFGCDMLAVIHGVFGQTDIKTSAHFYSSLF